MDHTRNVVYLDEGEIVTITQDGHEIRTIEDDTIINKAITEIDFSIEEIEPPPKKGIVIEQSKYEVKMKVQ